MDIEACLHKNNIDYLGVTEANLRKNADMSEVEIKGYRLVWDQGRENPNKENARVVVYIKEELSFDVMATYMGGDLMPEVWIKLGHAKTKRTLIGTVYREHTPWNTRDGSQKGQEVRLKRWLEARGEIWAGQQEAYVLGDINLDWLKRDEAGYRSMKMMRNLCDELQGAGWVQLIKKPTHFSNSEGRGASESLIDHVWTNLPAKVGAIGQEDTGTSDHELVWVDRMARQLVEKVKMTEKRSLKNFRLEDLVERCRQESWEYKGGGNRTPAMLDSRVSILTEKIRHILESVAPMRKKKLEQRGKPKWLTQQLELKMRSRAKLRKKAKSTKKMEDEMTARRVRNEVTREVKNAKREHLRKNLENLDKNSPDSWAAVGEHLGWRKPLAPTMLVQDGVVKSTGQDMAEAMIEQYRRKEEEVNRALGPARDDYLEAGRKMTKGNTAVFRFRKITKAEVEKQIRSVGNKESFGNDEISYGYLKKMAPWISGEMTAIMNLSLEVGSYPKSWKIARVKPLFKGEGCNRHDPKSYRPVALLSGMSRIMEGILARQLDEYQERNNLVHPGVHGYRKGRGTNTAMMEVWEYVLKKTEKGEIVALDFLDCSAGFDSMVHLYIRRKMEVHFGMDEASLKWLGSYLEGWIQYTVVEVSNSTPRKMRNGVPQGGGLSPILWRSGTNDIPEAGLRKQRWRRQEEVQEAGMNAHIEPGGHEERIGAEGAAQNLVGAISQRVDSILEEDLTSEERLDKELRRSGKWKLEIWRKERTGGTEEDSLKYRRVEDERDVVTTIYADDTQSRASARTLKELEKRNGEGVTRVCRALKAMRLKVNESKTTYMIMATQGIRTRENLMNKVSTIDVCGQKVKNVHVGKALGLLISDDITWKDQTEKVVSNCQLPAMRKDQRRLKAEAIILPRLSYSLEITSTGRKVDMERLQAIQSSAARWVNQTRKKDWRLKSGLKKLGWLSICQKAAYMSILMAMKVLKNEKPERLFESLTEIRDGTVQRKIVNERQFMQMKLTTRKSWSWRSLRWLEKIPETLRNQDPAKKSVKKELKNWIRDQVPVRGCRIMWGKKLEGEGGGRRRQRPRALHDEEEGPEGQNRGGSQSRDERENVGGEEDVVGNPELREAEERRRQGGTGNRRHNEQEEDPRKKSKAGKDTEARSMSGVALGDRPREKKNMMIRMKNNQGMKTEDSTGATTGDLRSMRTPPYSRTLNRAQNAGLGSSDDNEQRICCQLNVQGCGAKESRRLGGPDEGGDHREVVRGRRGWGRPPPWPPPAMWRTTRTID